MKRLLLVLGVSLALVALGGAAVAVLSQPSPSSSPTPKKSAQKEAKGGQTEEAGVHGGPIDRFHNAGACNLVDVSTLSGNWTHGDYVTAVEKAGDPALVPQAAHSDCGKPMVAVNHGGPPEFAKSASEQHGSVDGLSAVDHANSAGWIEGRGA